MTSFNLNYLLKALSPNIVTLGVSALTCGFWGDTIQLIAVDIFGKYNIPQALNCFPLFLPRKLKSSFSGDKWVKRAVLSLNCR